MNTWIFAATAAGASVESTFALAADKGLIVRPYFDDWKDMYRARNRNGDLRPGDRFLLVFAEKGRVLRSAAFILTADHSDTGLNSFASTVRDLAGRSFPQVFSAFPETDVRFENCGYDRLMMDPKLKKWVCLNVVPCSDSIIQDELQRAFTQRSNKRGTINSANAQVLAITG